MLVHSERELWLFTEARLEEKEALLLQQKISSQMEENDYGLELFTKDADVKDKEEAGDMMQPTAILSDTSKLSKREKLRILKKEYPEFINIVTDYRDQLTTYKERLLPILGLHKQGLIPDSSGVQLLKAKAKMVLDYCACAQFYLVLRSQKLGVEGHPVVKRMVQFKNLLKEMEKAELKLKPELDYLLAKVRLLTPNIPIHIIFIFYSTRHIQFSGIQLTLQRL